MYTIEFFKEKILQNAITEYSDDFSNLGDIEKYMAISKTVMDIIQEKWHASNKTNDNGKKAYYLSAEYLIGRLTSSNVLNLGIDSNLRTAVEELGSNLSVLEEYEDDAGLGNGGLGRLAACFLDSAATHDLPLNGYGIRYEFGLFRQKINDGYQDEQPDEWLKNGYPWEIRRTSGKKTIKFGGQTVYAVPYDIPVVGYDSNTINTLRIWSAEPVNSVDIHAFNDSRYEAAQSEANFARSISMVLYPNDNNTEGKILRLKQEYFFVSASIQDLIHVHVVDKKRDIRSFHEYHAVHLNDTHPALAIAEFMRIIVNDFGFTWKEGWDLTQKTFSYTNHTIMSEALEQWNRGVFANVLPEINQIVEIMNIQLTDALRKEGISEESISAISILTHDNVRMANLSILASHSVNGVAKLHTDILIEKELKEFYKVYPERFNNKTNGITQRRWLELCNPELSSLFAELLGSKEYLKNLDALENLRAYSNDVGVLDRFIEIKKTKKRELADFLYKKEGIVLNPDTIFDIQVKRLHEYKRQFLNILHVMDLYYRLKEIPNLDIQPRTFIFGAKSAPGYYRAKAIIQFINAAAKLINNDKDVNEKLAVHFVENYNVTSAQKIIPAADVSEQISTAGKEASGTGNMKFMLNGAVTLGTYDGANIEIFEAAGLENNYLFGAKVEELNAIRDSYDPKEYYWRAPGLKRAFDSLIDITFQNVNNEGFSDIYNSILNGTNWNRPDTYFIMKDFESYKAAQAQIDSDYRNKHLFASKCWNNLSMSGKFSSDRTIKEYANEIWGIHPVK